MIKNDKKHMIIIGIVIGVILLIPAAYWVYSSMQANNSNDCINYQNKELCTNRYEGLSLNEAREKAQDDGLTVKIRSIDGDTHITNTDLGGTLIFFIIDNDTVTKAEFK